MDFKINYQKFINRKLANIIKTQFKYSYASVCAWYYYIYSFLLNCYCLKFFQSKKSIVSLYKQPFNFTRLLPILIIILSTGNSIDRKVDDTRVPVSAAGYRTLFHGHHNHQYQYQYPQWTWEGSWVIRIIVRYI